ncbi:unnamed protein product, partial [Didymodactylos carnosus]
LGPWLAVEVPDLVQHGVIVHKERSAAPTNASGNTSNTSVQ